MTAATFSRVVTEIEPGPDGRLRPRPGALWRSEPAQGEAGIHRKLAGLLDASDSRLAAFASTYGPLRRGMAALQGAPGPIVRTAFIGMSHEMLDVVAQVRAWLDAGSPDPAPDGVADILLVADAFASLPEHVRRANRLLQAGAPEADIEAALGPVAFDPAPHIGGLFEAALARGRRHFDRVRDRERLADAVELLEWFGHILGGLDDEPAAAAELGGSAEGLRTLLVNMPEAFAHPDLADDRSIEGATLMANVAAESLADWREAASALANWVRVAALVHRALVGGLTKAERDDLALVYQSLTGSAPAKSLTAAELAERTVPLLVARVEAELHGGGAWPIRRGATLGLYWRALVSLWMALSDRDPLIMCATANCPGRFTLTRNRRYCDNCQAKRRGDAVARVRAKVARKANNPRQRSSGEGPRL